MAAQASNSRAEIVVKTLNGSLISVPLDVTSGKSKKNQILEQLYSNDPEKFPKGRTHLSRVEIEEGTTNSIKSGNLNELTNGEMVLATVADHILELDKVVGPDERYGGVYFYFFTITRRPDILNVLSIYRDPYDNEEESAEEVEKHIKQFNTQEVVIVYDPITKQHDLFEYSGDLLDGNVNDFKEEIKRIQDRLRSYRSIVPLFRDRIGGRKEMIYYIEHHGRFIQNNNNNNHNNYRMVRSDQGKKENIIQISYKLSPYTIDSIIQQIKNDPSTPADAAIKQQNGGRRRKMTRRSKNKKRKTIKRRHSSRK